jgi:protein SCO1/2
MSESKDPTQEETGAALSARRILWGRVALGLSLAVVLALTLAIALFEKTSPRSFAGKREAQVPDFVLTDQDGLPFTSQSLKGKVWVASFIFTRCTAACPAMAGKLLQVQEAVKAVPALAEKVCLLSFSVDPKRDTPEDLSSFSKASRADPNLWRFLTGEEGVVVQLSQEGFSLGANDGAAPAGDPAPELVHSDRFVLVDTEGYIRGYYRLTSEEGDLERLIGDIRHLASR